MPRRSSLAGKRVEVAVEDRRLSLSNLDKVLYPEVGFTKADVIDYYTRIAPVLLSHLRGRPLTLKRYPNGVEGKFFYEKQCPKHAPDWVRRVPVTGHRDGRVIDYTVVDDLPTLVWAANLADLELHPSLSLAEEIKRPTTAAFDLDPGEPATIVECARVALILRDVFAGLSLEAFAKTSGSKGMQVYLPLNEAGATYERTKGFARALADLLAREHPDLVVAKMAKAQRRGRVFVDWSQNDEHKTTICVYSLRARPTPTVSTPLKWDEVEQIAGGESPERFVFTSADVLARVERDGDLFAPVLELQQSLPG
ncbi:MAG: ATP-dependent DNA ligase [Thermoleophilaceae bacterium]|nr:ATP-dependent DNA ligase [Thermoleophilaceae bacterium]